MRVIDGQAEFNAQPPLWLWVIGIALTLLIGISATYFAPIEIGAMMDHFQFTASGAGALASAEFAGIALGSLLFPYIAPRVSLGRTAVACCLITAGANMASFAEPPLTIFAGLRGISGLACGAIFAVSCIWSAQSPSPARALGLASLIVNLAVAGIMIVIPVLALWLGRMGIFAIVAILALVGALCLLRIRPGEASGVESRPAYSGVPAPLLARAGFLAVVFLGNLSLSLVWQYAERLGVAHGFEMAAIATVLAVSSIMNIVGALMAAWVGDRFGSLKPIIAGLAIAIICGVVASTLPSYPFFMAAIAIGSGVYIFLIPYFIAGAGQFGDPDKLSAQAGGIGLIASATSPILGGMIVDHFAARGSGWSSALTALVGLLLTLVLLRVAPATRHTTPKPVL